MIKNNRGQIAIFVIIALIIVVSIVIVFTLLRPPELPSYASEDPQRYIEECMEESLQEANDLILEHNGYLNETQTNYMIFMGRNIPYLCTTSQFYVPCVPQEAMLLGKIREDIKIYIEPQVEECFESLEKVLRQKGYDVGDEVLDLEVEFKKEHLVASANKGLTIQKGEEIRIFSNFEAEIESPIYFLTGVANQIVNYESIMCQFDHMQWMMAFPELEINMYRTSDQTKVYTVKKREVDENFRFAIKTCVLPAGI